MDRNTQIYRRQGQALSPGVTRAPRLIQTTREPLTQQDELIRYIKEAWHKVNEPGPHGNGPLYYRNESDHTRPPGFTPFDLEGYWGKKLVQNIHVNQGHQ